MRQILTNSTAGVNDGLKEDLNEDSLEGSGEVTEDRDKEANEDSSEVAAGPEEAAEVEEQLRQTKSWSKSLVHNVVAVRLNNTI